MKILIFGLSGSGKTVLAKALEKKLEYCFHLNADEVREKYNDWDFSPEGRIRQAKRMSSLADELLKELDYVICDFICPTNETRKLVRPDYIIYMNTINKSIFEDTDKIFEIPELEDFDFKVEKKNAEYYSSKIIEDIKND
tara:strand:- start:123 stop:542 length:420 start_codon:yes stop_codon:yes gene_type:complete